MRDGSRSYRAHPTVFTLHLHASLSLSRSLSLLKSSRNVDLLVGSAEKHLFVSSEN
ncbi:unnamed protein product [Rhodiola kirilowii]